MRLYSDYVSQVPNCGLFLFLFINNNNSKLQNVSKLALFFDCIIMAIMAPSSSERGR